MNASTLWSCVGNTPLLRLKKLESHFGLSARLYAKVESANPAGSAKDRVAKAILEDAKEKGLLKEGAVVVEPTSGNTGIALAALCAAENIKLVIVMPESMSLERRLLISSYGATLVLTPTKDGMSGAISRAEEIVKTTEGAFMAGQFTNEANPRAHYTSTGPEIFDALDGTVAAFVAGVGTGGTITGVGRFLKEKNPTTFVLAVEPSDSAVLSGKAAGAHALQGIGAGFVPKVLDTAVYDEVAAVTKEEAYSFARLLAKEEGILAGISSGAALFSAVQLCKRAEFSSKNVVVLLPDGGERYLSSDLFETEEKTV